jgi:5-(carboxyamino)imidazole ribonucleotide synthase
MTTIGIIGGGQLGRMIALAGSKLGCRFLVLDPSPSACAGDVAELLVGRYDDESRLVELARRCDVVTVEFENVPPDAARYLAAHVPVHPSPEALHTCRDRLLEKEALRRFGVETAEYRTVDSEDDLRRAGEELGYPCFLKTRVFGYDGRGQYVLRSEADVVPAFEALGKVPLLCEARVPFEAELSVIAARRPSGEIRAYPLSVNVHHEGVLRFSRPGASPVTPDLQSRAEAMATRLMEGLGYVGILAVELFLTEGRLVANEMAPRVHNSGHHTLEGSRTSQFENHVRAVLDLPLGSTEMLRPTAMVNLLGKVPELGPLFAMSDVHVHAYGKSPAKGRKVGHVTVRADTEAELEATFERVARHVEPDLADRIPRR